MALQFPTNPSNGDTYSYGGKSYVYNSARNVWDIVSSTLDATANLAALESPIVPSANETVDLGSPTNRFKDLYLSGNTIYLGDTVLTQDSVGGASVTSYDTVAELPLTENSTGDQAFVVETNRLYIWNGSGWYNIALINTAPSITTGGAGSYELATDGTPTVITLVAEDPEGIPITWSYSVTSGSLGNTAAVSQVDNVFTITPSTNNADQGEFTITFTASDGVNIATDVNSFSLLFAVPEWSNVIFSLDANDTNPGVQLQNSTFIDRSTNAYTVTSSGTPSQAAFHPYLDNWSVEFDGSDDRLTTPSNSTNFGSSDFTIEYWVNHRTVGALFPVLDFRSGGSSPSIIIGVSNSYFGFYMDGAWIERTTLLANTHEWHHVALTRDGNNVRFFVDGTQIGDTYISTTNFSSGRVGIGFDDDGTPAYYLDGYVSNIRIVEGTSLYTTNFTPPTEKLTAVSGTSLLTCQSNRFVDNSTNAHVITVNGNPKVSSFNPFGQGSEYTHGENKGSYVNNLGTNAYLQTPKLIPSDGSNFTIEFWFYWNDKAASTTSSQQALFDQWGDGLAGRCIIWIKSSLMVDQSATTSITSPETILEHQWYHFAFVYSGSGNGEMFLNGVSQGSKTNFVDFANTPSTIGTYERNDLSRDYSFRGYISDFKVTNSAKYSANFTPPTEPLGNSGAIGYLPMDHAGIFDKTGNHSIRIFGNTYSSSLSNKYATNNVKFDGAGDYIRADEVLDLITNTSTPFTIETWFIYTSTAGTPYIFGLNTASGGANVLLASYDKIYTTAEYTWTAPAMGNGNWHHLAIVYSGTSIKAYLNGNLVRTVSSSLSTAPANCAFGIGAEFDGADGGAAGNYFYGHLENFQVSLGEKYTTNFTPPDRTQGITYQAES